MTERSDRPASLRTAVGVVWLLAALIVGWMGLLISGMSDHEDERVAGWISMAIALLGGAAAVVLFSGKPAWRLSLTVSGVFGLPPREGARP